MYKISQVPKIENLSGEINVLSDIIIKDLINYTKIFLQMSWM